MRTLPTRRKLLKTTGAGALAGASGLSFLHRLPGVSAAEAAVDPKRVALRPEIEPLVRLLEDTPRSRLLEEVGARVRQGVAYQDLLAALMLAGVRNIQPRPSVGFKFHAVLVVNSAHLASLSAPDSERWLPLFWALDYFKVAQARDVAEGDWTMAPVEEARVPPPHRAKKAFVEAMDSWDEEAADAAAAALARDAGAHEIFELLCRYGSRDFRDIGHKAIYVANGWRTLQVIGWQHAEPILRSLAYALLRHEGDNPAGRDADADRPGRENLERMHRIRAQWLAGSRDEAASASFLESLRSGAAGEVCDEAVNLINSGTHPQSLWDALFEAAAELLMRRPGIVALHAVTCANALYFAYRKASDDDTRRLLLLQGAAFLPLFRGDPSELRSVSLEDLDASPEASGDFEGGLDEVFAQVGRDPASAARMARAWLGGGGAAGDFVDTARRLVFLKGTNSHDYKFSSAVLEDFHHIAPGRRERFLAASVYNLRGSSAPDNDLAARIRSALSA